MTAKTFIIHADVDIKSIQVNDYIHVKKRRNTTLNWIEFETKSGVEISIKRWNLFLCSGFQNKFGTLVDGNCYILKCNSLLENEWTVVYCTTLNN